MMAILKVVIMITIKEFPSDTVIPKQNCSSLPHDDGASIFTHKVYIQRDLNCSDPPYHRRIIISINFDSSKALNKRSFIRFSASYLT